MAGSRLQVSDKGKPYMQLANALKYQKSYDPSCSCKKDGETWARALQKAERMLAAHKSDVLVTQEVADRLSRAGTGEAKSARITRKSTNVQMATKAGPAEPETTGSVVPTPVAASAADVPATGGERPKPRIIAPDVIPVPGTGRDEPTSVTPRP
jgi:hypothetical protein